MATLDDILGGATTNGGGSSTQKGLQEQKEENSGENSSVSSSTETQSQSGSNSNPSSGADATASGGGGGGYEKLLNQLNPYTIPSEKDLEKERKREKRAQLFAAIGDGIAALSNLFFTTQGAPSMYDGKNTITGANKVRYDKLVKDREGKNDAYFNSLMRARQADSENANRERSWQRQLGLDKEARDRYQESIAHRNERERIADERYKSEQDYRMGRDEESDKRWKATFAENKRQHNENIKVRREQARATAARGVRGKQLGFADGNGNQVAIYENVWKGSMQQVYDAMLEDLAPAEKKKLKKELDTPQKKEDYVKQNWHKSPKASKIMLTLSGIDPANMTSELNDEVIDYTPGGDDEVIDYVPGKK